jgi:hypothetical protein
LQNSDNEVFINRGWKTIREIIAILAKLSLGYYTRKLEKNRPCFDESCLELSDEMKQPKLQCLQYESEINIDNMSNIKLEAGRHFKNET